jgi:CspA family cold shock protein
MLNDDTEVRHATGTVLWFDFAKGHGFVMCDAGGPDCFLHQSTICAQDQRRIEEGSRVAFDIVEGLGGPLTANVRRL